jgi:mRNA-degrading endonuclease RelE of RelBE toxin-antitoxin system
MNEIITVYDDSFLDQYDCLPRQIKEKFKKQIKTLRNNPKHPSLRIHRIKGTEFWDFYVDEHYRCVFKQTGNIYSLYFVGTHKLIDRFNGH